MSKFKKVLSLVAIISFIIMCSFVVISRVYFFNPFTFKKDNITYSDWHQYKNPVSLTIEYYDEQFKGVHKTIQKKDTLLYILNELKTSPRISKSNYEAPTSFDKPREFYQINFLANKNEVMMSATVYRTDQIVVINKYSEVEEIIKASKKLIDFLDSV
jgi:hypothetical protein